MRRRTLAAALACLTLASGCAGGAVEEAARSADLVARDPAAVTGQVTYWDTSNATNEAPVFKALIEQFHRRYPKVRVKYVNVPFDQAQNKFKNAAGSFSAADVIRAEVAWTPEFAALGYLQPLDETPLVKDAKDFLPAAAESTRYNGKTYGIPQVTDTIGLLYNKELLARAGVSRPPTTMAELKEAALRVSQRTGAQGLYLNPGGYFLLPHLYGEGADVLDVKTRQITVNSPAAVRAVAQVQDLIAAGAAPKPDFADGYSNMMAGFRDGRIAMILNGPWSVADIFTGKAFTDRSNLGVAPVPAGSTGRAGAPIGGHNYGVYAGSENLAASYLFVQFMSSTQSQAKVARELGLLPTRRSAYTQPGVVANATVGPYRSVLETAHGRPWIAEGGLLFGPLDQNYVKILSGAATPQQGLDAVAAEYRKFLKGWK